LEDSLGEPYAQRALSVDAYAEQEVFSKDVVVIVRRVVWMLLTVVDNPKTCQEHVLCLDVSAVQVVEKSMQPYKPHVQSVVVYAVHTLFLKPKGVWVEDLPRSDQQI
jgi:hypothetical protein